MEIVKPEAAEAVRRRQGPNQSAQTGDEVVCADADADEAEALEEELRPARSATAISRSSSNPNASAMSNSASSQQATTIEFSWMLDSNPVESHKCRTPRDGARLFPLAERPSVGSPNANRNSVDWAVLNVRHSSRNLT